MDSWDRMPEGLKGQVFERRMPEGLKGQVFERLAHLAAVANLSEADEIAYEKALDQYYIDQTVRHDEYVKGHEKGIKKGIEIGKIEGREQGIEIGKAEGLAQGRQEEKWATARNMKSEGIPSDIIQRCTGLPLEEIERL